MSKAEFRSDVSKTSRHMRAVFDAARLCVRGKSAWAVLEAMQRMAEYDRPECTITKDQLAQQAMRTRRSIQTALKELKELGVITPIRNVVGGRGNAVTYRFNVVGQGAAKPNYTQEQAAGQEVWDVVRAKFERIDAGQFNTWIAKLNLFEIADGHAVLQCSNGFLVQRVVTDYQKTLIELFASVDPSVTKVTIRKTPT